MSLTRPNEFVLAKDANGKHFEEFCGDEDSEKSTAIIQRAKAGTLGGHIPKSDEAYSFRPYFHKHGRLLAKLTKKKKSAQR